jgi:hypothetical protein
MLMSKLEKSLTEDDLFCRVLYTFLAISFANFARSFPLDLASQQFVGHSRWFYVGGWLTVIVWIALTPLFLIQALAHPTSVAYILTKNTVPDAKDQRSRILLNLFFLLPIVIVTICLRTTGVRGYMVQ